MLLKYAMMNNKRYGNSSKEQIIEKMVNSDKPIRYTLGFKYRNPTTYEVPIELDEAVKIFNKGMSDLTEKETYWDLNEFSGNDLF